MPQNMQSLWDDENFTVRTGYIPGQHKLSGAELGPGIIYYPVDVNLTHHVAGTIETVRHRRSSLGELNFLWNTGEESEILNPHKSSSPFVYVGLKPSPQLEAELPQGYLGLASAALIQDDWDEQFKESVRDDLDVIHGFVEPLRFGQPPSDDTRERAILAKEDLDLKLRWSANEYKHHGLFNAGYRVIGLAAATPATGLINVTVDTKDSSNTSVGGWKVRYVKSIKHGKPPFYRSFGKNSTPTSEQMAVGNYEMWGEKPGTTGPTQVVSVISVSTVQFVDLWVP